MNSNKMWFMGFALIMVILPFNTYSDSVKFVTAEAVKVSPFLGGEMGQKLEFNFQGVNEGKAWLKQTGQWQIEAWIKHPHFRCAHYRLGMQFGKGAPGCLNVKWLKNPVYISDKRQCNNVSVHHSGIYEDSELAEVFSGLTCARQVIKCRGVCD